MKRYLNEMQEHDKRMGFPDFNWTPEMEAENWTPEKEQLSIPRVVQAEPEKLIDIHSFEGVVPYGRCNVCGKGEWAHEL